MITRDEALELQGFRVQIAFNQRVLLGTLRSVTPTDRVIIADERGMETLLELENVNGISDARHTCIDCGDKVNRVFDKRCAECTRAFALTQPAPQEPCEKCGSRPAVFSPRARIFGCAPCLAEMGGLTGMGAEVRVLTHESRLAECRTLPVDDPKHGPWRRAKSAYVCSACYGKFFEKPAGFV